VGSGQRRKAHGSERSMAILLGGALTCVLAVCAIAGLFILKNASANQPRDHQVAPASQQSPTDADAKVGAPSPQVSLVDVVVDACDAGVAVAAKLVPGGDQISNEAGSSDTESSCQWGKYEQARPRALTITIRSIQGGDPVALAKRQYNDEWAADRAGKSLLPGQTLRDKDTVPNLGEQAYALYFTQSDVAEAVVNVQISNVLITVHYGGSDGRKRLMSRDEAVGGAVEAAESTIAALEKAAQ
jgi:hypothetical protein